MSMKVRKLPVELRAFKIPSNPTMVHTPNWIHKAIHDKVIHVHYPNDKPRELQYHELHIHTLEGMMIGKPGDYIIQGVVGELYPVREEIFVLSYEVLDDE